MRSTSDTRPVKKWIFSSKFQIFQETITEITANNIILVDLNLRNVKQNLFLEFINLRIKYDILN